MVAFTIKENIVLNMSCGVLYVLTSSMPQEGIKKHLSGERDAAKFSFYFQCLARTFEHAQALRVGALIELRW